MTRIWFDNFVRRPALVVAIMRRIRKKQAHGNYATSVTNEEGDMRGELEHFLQQYAVHGIQEGIRN